MVTRTRLRLHDFLAMPEIDERRLELIDGEVCEKPMPRWGRGRIALNTGKILDPYGYPAVEPRAIIPGGGDRADSAPIPDVAFYLDNPPADDDWMRRPPDIAIEILSPGQSLREMRAKVDLYRDFGVRSVWWVIDPESRSVDIYESGARRTMQAGEALTTAVIPALQLPVAALFDRAHKPPPGEPAG